jgi:CMP-N,N'-diacetyllegionaminic acid synthase
MSTSVGIITARGASKGIPRKNIAMLPGRPLLAYSIEEANKSKTLERVIISTDDDEIAAIAKDCGAEVPFQRPQELAADDTPTLIVVQHAARWLEHNEGMKIHIVAALQRTSPLRRTHHIDAAVRKLLDTRADSVVSVCLVRRSPYWMKQLKGDRVFPFLPEAVEYTCRQDLPPVYRLNGAVYVMRRDVLMEKRRLSGQDTRAIAMDPESSDRTI